MNSNSLNLHCYANSSNIMHCWIKGHKMCSSKHTSEGGITGTDNTKEAIMTGLMTSKSTSREVFNTNDLTLALSIFQNEALRRGTTSRSIRIDADACKNYEVVLREVLTALHPKVRTETAPAPLIITPGSVTDAKSLTARLATSSDKLDLLHMSNNRHEFRHWRRKSLVTNWRSLVGKNANGEYNALLTKPHEYGNFFSALLQDTNDDDITIIVVNPEREYPGVGARTFIEDVRRKLAVTNRNPLIIEVYGSALTKSPTRDSDYRAEFTLECDDDPYWSMYRSDKIAYVMNLARSEGWEKVGDFRARFNIPTPSDA